MTEEPTKVMRCDRCGENFDAYTGQTICFACVHEMDIALKELDDQASRNDRFNPDADHLWP